MNDKTTTKIKERKKRYLNYHKIFYWRLLDYDRDKLIFMNWILNRKEENRFSFLPSNDSDFMEYTLYDLYHFFHQYKGY